VLTKRAKFRRSIILSRHGTTTLFAALNVLDGTVIGGNTKRHRHQEFIMISDWLVQPKGQIMVASEHCLKSSRRGCGPHP
jgi:hypothetical protein